MSYSKNNFARARILVGLALVASLAACGKSEPEKVQATAASYQVVMDKAAKANAEAIALEYQWTTVPELMKQAEDAAAAGDFESASQYAQTALAHSKRSIEQAREQAEAWQAAAPR